MDAISNMAPRKRVFRFVRQLKATRSTDNKIFSRLTCKSIVDSNKSPWVTVAQFHLTIVHDATRTLILHVQLRLSGAVGPILVRCQVKAAILNL